MLGVSSFAVGYVKPRRQAANHKTDGGDGQRQHGAVSAHELGSSVADCVWPRADRHVPLKSLEVVGECGDRYLPFCGVLLERLADNRIEVAVQQAAELFRCASAVFSGFVRLGR